MQKLKLQFKIKNSEKAFSTLEILIAMALIVGVITSVLPLVSGGQDTAIGSYANQEALYKAKDLLENARASSLLDFNSVVTANYPNEGIYARNIIVNDLDSFTKQVTSNVAWKMGGQSLAVNLTTLLTNPQMASDMCSSALVGDWTNPQLLGTANVDQNSVGTDVDVSNKKAYITTNSAIISKPDFYVVDVSNPNLSKLPILGSINTGPGLAALHVAEKYAYAANMSATNQLQVIDISAILPIETIGSRRDVTLAGDSAVGNSIFYADKKIYLGLTKSDGPEFHVFDVTDPLNPSKIASFETNTQVSAIVVKNNIAYLAVPDDPNTIFINEKLRILDVSQADFGLISQINTFGQNPITMSGESLYLSQDGNTLYFAEGGANPSDNPQLFVINVVDPKAYPLPVLKSKYIDTSNDVSVRALIVRSNLAFTINSDPNEDFQIWDLNNLSSPIYYGYLDVDQVSVGGMDCEANYIYIAQRTNKALQIIGPGE